MRTVVQPALLPTEWSGGTANAAAGAVRVTILATAIARPVALAIAAIIARGIAAGIATGELATGFDQQSAWIALAGGAAGTTTLARIALAGIGHPRAVRATGLATTTGVVMQTPHAEGHEAR